MQKALVVPAGLDAESAGWVRVLAGGGPRREAALARLHELLHVYAELVASGEPAEQRYPGIAAHLHACGPCGEDFDGLLAAIGGRVD